MNIEIQVERLYCCKQLPGKLPSVLPIIRSTNAFSWLANVVGLAFAVEEHQFLPGRHTHTSIYLYLWYTLARALADKHTHTHNVTLRACGRLVERTTSHNWPKEQLHKRTTVRTDMWPIEQLYKWPIDDGVIEHLVERTFSRKTVQWPNEKVTKNCWMNDWRVVQLTEHIFLFLLSNCHKDNRLKKQVPKLHISGRIFHRKFKYCRSDQKPVAKVHNSWRTSTELLHLKAYLHWTFLVRDSWLWLGTSDCLLVDWDSWPIGS